MNHNVLKRVKLWLSVGCWSILCYWWYWWQWLMVTRW